MSILIQAISAKDTLPLRHKILWPDYPIESSIVDGDETALHFGGFLDENLICVASLFRDGSAVRLRKFATDVNVQGQGFGSAMLQHHLEIALKSGAKVFWFDAREAALPFYERYGFTKEGGHFFKGDIPYFRMSQRLELVS